MDQNPTVGQSRFPFPLPGLVALFCTLQNSPCYGFPPHPPQEYPLAFVNQVSGRPPLMFPPHLPLPILFFLVLTPQVTPPPPLLWVNCVRKPFESLARCFPFLLSFLFPPYQSDPNSDIAPFPLFPVYHSPIRKFLPYVRVEHFASLVDLCFRLNITSSRTNCLRCRGPPFSCYAGIPHGTGDPQMKTPPVKAKQFIFDTHPPDPGTDLRFGFRFSKAFFPDGDHFVFFVTPPLAQILAFHGGFPPLSPMFLTC